MEHYAYVRVSTKEQNIDRQKIALEVYQIPEQNIYCDYQSGKNFERPEYQKMIKKLKPGDLVVIKSIDRLGDFGYAPESRESHWNINCRFSITDICLCGTNRT